MQNSVTLKYHFIMLTFIFLVIKFKFIRRLIPLQTIKLLRILKKHEVL